ncbi:MAG: hypothetical protein IKE52_01990 [Mogibacterium sp.]|nr:hypothetical protein [Mogibacterium sp.]
MKERVGLRKRIIAAIIMTVFFLIVLLSSFFVAAEAEHDCSGDDCPICDYIHICENLLHQTSAGSPMDASSIIPDVFVFLSVLLIAYDLLRETPVSRKVRMNN